MERDKRADALSAEVSNARGARSARQRRLARRAPPRWPGTRRRRTRRRPRVRRARPYFGGWRRAVQRRDQPDQAAAARSTPPKRPLRRRPAAGASAEQARKAEARAPAGAHRVPRRPAPAGARRAGQRGRSTSRTAKAWCPIEPRGLSSSPNAAGAAYEWNTARYRAGHHEGRPFRRPGGLTRALRRLATGAPQQLACATPAQALAALAMFARQPRLSARSCSIVLQHLRPDELTRLRPDGIGHERRRDERARERRPRRRRSRGAPGSRRCFLPSSDDGGLGTGAGPARAARGREVRRVDGAPRRRAERKTASAGTERPSVRRAAAWPTPSPLPATRGAPRRPRRRPSRASPLSGAAAPMPFRKVEGRADASRDAKGDRDGGARLSGRGRACSLQRPPTKMGVGRRRSRPRQSRTTAAAVEDDATENESSALGVDARRRRVVGGRDPRRERPCRGRAPAGQGEEARSSRRREVSSAEGEVNEVKPGPAELRPRAAPLPSRLGAASRAPSRRAGDGVGPTAGARERPG